MRLGLEVTSDSITGGGLSSSSSLYSVMVILLEAAIKKGVCLLFKDPDFMQKGFALEAEKQENLREWVGIYKEHEDEAEEVEVDWEQNGEEKEGFTYREVDMMVGCLNGAKYNGVVYQLE